MARQRIPRLGITGGIGSGKSTATAFFGELGAATVSADELVHELLEQPEIVSDVSRHFGDGVVCDGAVDSHALARIVFDDAAALAWLEELLHPGVKQEVDLWAREQEARPQAPPLLVAEIPLLFESGMQDAFDYVLLVTAPEAVRRKRLAAKLTASEFGRRAARQFDEPAKAERCDFVVENSGARRRLKQSVSEIYAQILAAGLPKARPGAREA